MDKEAFSLSRLPYEYARIKCMPAIYQVLVQVSMDQSTFYSQLSCVITALLLSWFDLNRYISLSLSVCLYLFFVPSKKMAMFLLMYGSRSIRFTLGRLSGLWLSMTLISIVSSGLYCFGMAGIYESGQDLTIFNEI